MRAGVDARRVSDPAAAVSSAGHGVQVGSGRLNRPREQRLTPAAFYGLLLVSLVLGAGVTGRTVAGLLGADGVWFSALQIPGFGLVFGLLYLVAPHSLFDVREPTAEPPATVPS